MKIKWNKIDDKCLSCFSRLGSHHVVLNNVNEMEQTLSWSNIKSYPRHSPGQHGLTAKQLKVPPEPGYDGNNRGHRHHAGHHQQGEDLGVFQPEHKHPGDEKDDHHSDYVWPGLIFRGISTCFRKKKGSHRSMRSVACRGVVIRLIWAAHLKCTFLPAHRSWRPGRNSGCERGRHTPKRGPKFPSTWLGRARKSPPGGSSGCSTFAGTLRWICTPLFRKRIDNRNKFNNLPHFFN